MLARYQPKSDSSLIPFGGDDSRGYPTWQAQPHKPSHNGCLLAIKPNPRYSPAMSDTEVMVPEPAQELTGQRGLDIEKVEMVMSREQERDLTFLFRVDQLKLFDPNAKTYHRKAKSGDPVTIQLLFEMRDMYTACKEANDPKTVAKLLEPIGDAIAKAEAAGHKDMAEKLSKQMDEMVARFRAAGDPKLAHSLLKQMDDIAARAEARRDKALERLFAWKKQAEDNGKGLGDLSQDELRKLADG